MSSLRREYLDDVLKKFEHEFARGLILDIGGKRTGTRGMWRPSQENVDRWRYVNLDPAATPDYLVSAEDTGLPEHGFDTFIMCELLEHVLDPETVINEAYRILKPGGYGLVTMPFLNQVHPDPEDYQRWTSRKLYLALERAGFETLWIEPMGSIWAVVHDLIRAAAHRLHEQQNRHQMFCSRILLSLMSASRPIWKHADARAVGLHNSVTTGWACCVYRAESP